MRTRWFHHSAVVLAVLFACSLWAQEIEIHQGKEASAREVLVKFRAISGGDRARLRAENAIDQEEEVGGTGVVRLHSAAKNIQALLQALRARPDVEYAEPNYIVHAIAVPNDPSFPSLYAMRNTGQTVNGTTGTAGADIRATAAWDVSTGSSNVMVGVVDTGVDYTHPDLANNVWSAPQSFTVTIGGSTITCAAGTHGFNAISRTCNPFDDNQHGTHVSGTIGALGNNAVGVVGVNWITRIVGLKFLSSTGSGTTANAINAIEFAIQAKSALNLPLRVLSNSWGGGGFSQALLDEINKANANNMLFVAAAGNNGTNNDTTANFPSNYNAPNVVAVAATDNRDLLASFSNFGATTVDLGAPGVNILSTIPSNRYAFFSGTSMATPHVSGAAALVLSVPACNTALDTPDKLKSNLLNNVDPIPSLAGKTVTGGRLNVDKAIRACANVGPDFSLATTPTSRSVVTGSSASYTVTVTPSGGFTGAVSFSVAGVPAGASASFSPTSVAGSGSTTLTVATGTAATGTYNLTITGASGTLSHTTTAQLTITAAPVPDFTISRSPTSLTVAQGSSGTSTVTTAVSGGFNNTITLSASGVPTGVTASFSVNPIPAPGSGSSTLTFNVASTAATGTFTITVTGTGGGVTHSTTVSLTVTTAGGTQLLGNPGFEQGSSNPAPWSATAGVIDSTAAQPAHSGAWKAWLDGYGVTHTDTLSQQVSIPSTATSATLTFWLHIDSAETTTTTAFDRLSVQIRNTSGTVLATLATFSNLNKAAGYSQKTFDLTAFKGQTVRIFFLGQEDSSLQTSFVIDDTALTVR